MEGECDGIIENGWIGGSSLMAKMEMCAAELQEWNKMNLGKVFVNLRKKRKALKNLNPGGLSSTQLAQHRKLLLEIAELNSIKEVFLVAEVEGFVVERRR